MGGVRIPGLKNKHKNSEFRCHSALTKCNEPVSKYKCTLNEVGIPYLDNVKFGYFIYNYLGYFQTFKVVTINVPGYADLH